MGVFYALLLVPIIVQHIAIKGHRVEYGRKNRWALAYFFVFLTVLVMFRHESVGNDTRNYINIFRSYSRMSWRHIGMLAKEQGFGFLNKLVSLLSSQPQFFLAVAALITSALIYPTYKRLCVDAVLTIVLFSIMSTFVMMFSGIRQMLAVGFGFVAYEFARKKQLWLYLLFVLLAIAFHISAVMLLFMYPLYHARITKKWLYAVVPALVIIFIFNEPIFNYLALFMEIYMGFEGSIENTGAYTMLFLFALFAVFSYIIPDEAKLDQETVGMRNFLLLSLVVQMFAPLNTLAMRMSYYYIIFIPLLLPKIIAFRRRSWNQIALTARHVMVVFFLLYFFVIKANSDGNLRVFPYHFFWERLE